MSTLPNRPPKSSSSSSTKQDEQHPEQGNSDNNNNTNFSSIAETLRNQPARKSLIGGVKTRQPDYEQRHLEMMRYLASLKHGGSSKSGGDASRATTTSEYQQQVLNRNHESEVLRVRHSFEGKRKFKTPDSGELLNVSKKVQQQQELIDPVTGLPNANIGTLNLKNHPGMQQISPWGILSHWLRQTFRSTTMLVLVLGFLIVMNVKRLGVLFSIHVPKNETTTTATASST
jgi:hypothetical protein